MSRKFYFLLLVGISTLMLSSCRKEHDNENKSVTLDVSINAGEMYQLGLEQYGGAQSFANIAKQAGNYTTSKISRDGSGNYIYQFLKAGTPKIGGNGTDQVLLKIAEPSGRCNHRGDETNITINFTIL